MGRGGKREREGGGLAGDLAGRSPRRRRIMDKEFVGERVYIEETGLRTQVSPAAIFLNG